MVEGLPLAKILDRSHLTKSKFRSNDESGHESYMKRLEDEEHTDNP